MDADQIGSSLLWIVGIMAVVFVIAFVYETGRSINFWAAAAKLYGWSEDEKFERKTARVQRQFE
jgi:hypothetical protein